MHTQPARPASDVSFTFRIPSALLDEARTTAHERGEALSAVIRRGLTEYLAADETNAQDRAEVAA